MTFYTLLLNHGLIAYTVDMTVQKILRDDFIEDYETGEFQTVIKTGEDYFQRAIDKKTMFLFYAYGVYCTAYAQYNLFQLGKCFDAENWLYSDTDSVYGIAPDEEKIKAYNDNCKKLLLANGYGAVQHNGRDHWLGVAEKDGEYTEFITQGAKRYAVRKPLKFGFVKLGGDYDGSIKITVAGVPKKTGAKCLKNDLENFKSGFIFRGDETGKLTYFYKYADSITQDANGNWIADSINLVPCDYLLATTIEQKINEEWGYDELELYNLVYDDELL